MTQKLLGVLALLAIGYGVYFLFNYYREFEAKNPSATVTAPTDPGAGTVAAEAPIPAEAMAGLHPSLEASLKAAYAQGEPGLAKWLKSYSRSVADPRLAMIQLDYAALLARNDPAAARNLFKAVQRRTPPNSPVYSRVKKLEAAYQ